MTRAKWIALLLVAIAVIFIGAARIGLLEADYEEALLRYGSPPSQFAEIDGTRLH